MRSWKYVYLVFFIFSLYFIQSQQVHERSKRQIGGIIWSAIHNLQNNFRRHAYAFDRNMDEEIVPRVRYAANTIKHEVAPKIASAVKQATNKVVLTTAEGVQKTAIFIAEKVAPVIEDTVVDITNAAMPVVNQGIDVVESGIQSSVDVVSKETSTGIDKLGRKVLGENRHNRIKKIANNLSINLNNSLNSLAGAIKKVSQTNDPSNPSTNYFDFYDYYNTIPKFSDYDINNDYAAYIDYIDESQSPQPVTFPKVLGKLVSDTAYSISKQILGPNLTDAVAPLARSVTDTLTDNLNSISTPGAANNEVDVSTLRKCTTPNKRKGYCQDLSDCPELVLTFSTLRRSVCFKALFSPGICCPDKGQFKKHIRDSQKAKPIRAQTPAIQQSPAVNPYGLQPGQYQVLANGQIIPIQHNSIQSQTHGTAHSQIPTGIHSQTNQAFSTQTNPGFPHHVQPGTSNTVNQGFTNKNIGPDNRIINKRQRNDAFECGLQKVGEERVVGGARSHMGEWPWMAAIYLHGPAKTEFWCGGTLISENYVVTAAHCTKDSNGKSYKPSQFSVHLGDNIIFNEDDDRISDPKEYMVRSITAHPDFQRTGYFNDIALLKLSRTVNFSPYVLPICLPPVALELNPLDYLVNKKATVIGYGSTSYDGRQSNALRDVRVPIWTNDECDKTFFQPITNIFLCAGSPEGGKDACQGDSGGPLQLYMNGRWSLIGIVSFGNRCAEPGYPGVYTRISTFLPWIRENIR